MIRTGLLASLLLASLVACGTHEAKSAQSLQDNGVPANSLSEKRLKGDEKKPEEKQPEPKPEITQPYTQPVTPAGDDSAGPAAPAGKGAAKGGGKIISKAECGQVFDKYLELAIGGDARLEGIPPELIQQAKAQARQQKGDPCEKESVPRTKYTCAMAAQTTKEWEKCMK